MPRSAASPVRRVAHSSQLTPALDLSSPANLSPVPEKIRRYTLKQPAKPQKQYRVRYEDELNQEQLDVVMAGEGPMLVIAGVIFYWR